MILGYILLKGTEIPSFESLHIGITRGVWRSKSDGHSNQRAWAPKWYFINHKRNKDSQAISNKKNSLTSRFKERNPQGNTCLIRQIVVNARLASTTLPYSPYCYSPNCHTPNCHT